MSNLQRLRAAMAEQGVENLVVTDRLNVRWLTGFTGSAAVVLVGPKSAAFLTDSRYTIQAESEVTEFPVKSFAAPQTWDGVFGETLSDLGFTKVAFDPATSFSTVEKRKKDFSGVEWVSMPEDLFHDLRKIKTPEEIAITREACKLTDACFEHVSRMLQIGVREYDLCLEVEFFYRRQGAEIGFDPIVVSGPNSAKPHGKPGERKLEVGDFVTIDCGARWKGYHGDVTRTFVVGEPTARHREIYEQVLKAEVECCAALVPGADGKDIDALARRILDEKGLAKYFGHGLGHGLGLYIHDAGRLSSQSSEEIQENMIFTVEPGVYIPDFGGVRIEDDVLVTANGPELLTHFPKELTVVG